MSKDIAGVKFCPECGIGLNNAERQLRICTNCKADWNESEENDDDEDYFEPCDHCDLPDACADFGCAIKMGVRKNYPIDGVF